MPTNTQAMDYAGSSAPLLSEILTKVNNAKMKEDKVKVLKQNDSVPLRQILKGAFAPKIEWDFPEGSPPSKVNEAPAGTEHTLLYTESKRLWHFVKGADTRTTKTRKEMLYIQMLEGLHADEAKLLIATKEKNLNNLYKGLTDAVVKEAFGWNDDYKTA